MRWEEPRSKEDVAMGIRNTKKEELRWLEAKTLDANAFEPLRVTGDLRDRLRRALGEDVGSGDVTTRAVIERPTPGRAVIMAREEGVLCGIPVVREIFRLADRRLEVTALRKDGARLADGDEVIAVRGNVASILTAERTALNFIQQLSGVATLTAEFVEAVRGTKTRVLDTRKTTPLWRDLEKYAVRVGGGENHRFGLYDMVLVKNNHVDAAGSLAEAIVRVKEYLGKRYARAQRRRAGAGKAASSRRTPKWPAGGLRPMRAGEIRICVEARDLDEVRQAVEGQVDIILLDNFTTTQLRKALALIPPSIETEASGGMTVRRVQALAGLGLDRISVGALTHSAPAMDFSLRYRKP
jgi:nicotinate-nucleotide pyrophosphorylase (carboxylating)